jgi:hypothetical protein
VTDRRHPAEVTADRMLMHFHAWHDRLTASERDAISHVAGVLYGIAYDDRPAPTTRRRDQPGNHTTETR